jgi:acyl-CoA synthetase (AMP-forming)/AMP-acid ligase II
MRQQSAPDLVRLLARRAAEQPDDQAFTFLGDGESPSDSTTWSALDAASRAVAATLARHVAAGDRVLVVCPPGLEFLAGFFGCLYAAAIAVPVPLPRPGRQDAARARFHAILSDAVPAAVLTTESVLPLVNRLGQEDARLGQRQARAPHVLAIDAIATGNGTTWTPPSIGSDTTAFLQYTSGSTAEPRGVMVSHGNVLHNLESARAMATAGPVDASVSWLPPTHDMGLIEGLLQPVLRGHHAVLLPPASFLQRPIRWLRAIATCRAARSGGPNFAYDLCARRVTDADLEGLDLSCWRDAYNGAEPVRRETLAAFAARFRPAGFRPEAFRPCYGLAEATLLVACGRWNTSGTGSVACGTPAPATELAIVDPVTRHRCKPGETGEIWVSGPGVARGYWGARTLSAPVFGAKLDGDDRAYLRTGDLGRLEDDGLHVTGRIKDVLIVRGQKHFPADIEMTAARADPAVLPFGVAAFAAGSSADGDRIVIALEVERRWLARGRSADAVAAAVRGAVVDAHGIDIDDVVLLPPRMLPRTTSGKVQRYRCQERWRLGQLQAVEPALVS